MTSWNEKWRGFRGMLEVQTASIPLSLVIAYNGIILYKPEKSLDRAFCLVVIKSNIILWPQNAHIL